mgnify:FL=1
MNSMFQPITVDVSDVQRIIFDKLEPALSGEKHATKVLAMLTFVILLEKPEIDVDELQDIIMGTSEYLALSLSSDDGVAN